MCAVLNTNLNEDVNSTVHIHKCVAGGGADGSIGKAGSWEEGSAWGEGRWGDSTQTNFPKIPL